MAVKIIYFVHGTTTDNLEHKASGWIPGELSEKGVQQGLDLRKQINLDDIDIVISSDLKRAIDSASNVFKNDKVIVHDERIRECNYGDLNGKDTSLVKYEDHINTAFPNGESLIDVEKRMRDFCEYLLENFDGKCVALVSHKAPQLALEVITKNISWEEAIENDWRKTKSWRPGWEYTIECKKKEKVTAVVLAAGNSTRYGKNKNKNLEMINGKPVFMYSLEAFDKNEYVDDIVVVAKKEELEKLEDIVSHRQNSKNIKVVVGGSERKDSVYNAIKSTDSDIVIIQDGARPVIKQKYINECIENMNEYKGVAIGVKSKDTVKMINDENIVINTTNRDNTYLIQTPQCFRRRVLFDMHEKYKHTCVTDDCEILEKDCYKIKVLDGDYTNIKITTYDDLNIAKLFLENGQD